MNYEQANKVKHLASDVMKVLERLEWECPECRGSGTIGIPDKTIEPPAHKIELVNCSFCVKGKLHYSWIPQVGEWCFDSRKLLLLVLDVWNQGRHIRTWNFSEVVISMSKEVTPILKWEIIEEILEKVGYWIWLKGNGNKWEAAAGRGGIDVSNRVFGKVSRQEAVMKAVLELGKEMK